MSKLEKAEIEERLLDRSMHNPPVRNCCTFGSILVPKGILT